MSKEDRYSVRRRIHCEECSNKLSEVDEFILVQEEYGLLAVCPKCYNKHVSSGRWKKNG